MIAMTIDVKTHSNNQMEFEQTLEGAQFSETQITGLIKKWLNEKGCINYQLYRANVRTFSLESEWHSWVDLNNHFRSNDFSLFLAAIDILCENRKVKIIDGKFTLGIEAIEDARAN
jgi:quinol monooxygenase YgiN